MILRRQRVINFILNNYIGTGSTYAIFFFFFCGYTYDGVVLKFQIKLIIYTYASAKRLIKWTRINLRQSVEVYTIIDSARNREEVQV